MAAADRPETLRTEDDVDKKDSGDGAEISDIAAKIAYDLTQKIEAIESDPSIPVRAKKTKGEKCMLQHLLITARARKDTVDVVIHTQPRKTCVKSNTKSQRTG